MLDKLIDEIRIIFESFDIDWKTSFLKWDIPENIKADLAINILPIIFKQKENELKIIDTFIKKINELRCDSFFYNGYINIVFFIDYYKKIFQKNIPIKKKERINIEFVSANPTGYLHLAHIRQAFFGNVLSNIYKACGYDVIKEYYINDKGKQIDDLLSSVEFFLSNKKKKNHIIKYPQKSTEDISLFLKKTLKKDFLTSLNKKKREKIKNESVNFILKNVKKDLKKCGVKFDLWTSEKKLYLLNRNNIKKTIKEWEKRNLVYSKDGCLFFRSTLEGDDKDRVLIKKNKEHTYFFSDIFFHQKKLNENQGLINIWGSDHIGYVSRLLASCKTLLNENKKKIQIIILEMIHLLLEDGKKKKLSKRHGNTISLKETLKHIDMDQLKFFCLEKDPSMEILINEKILKEKQEKSRVYYIQYSYARCCGVLRKSKNFFKDKKKEKKISLLISGNKERKILNHLLHYCITLEDSRRNNKPHIMLYYLIELSKIWQNYYSTGDQILNEKEVTLSIAKLEMVKKIKLVLWRGLKLLGMKVYKNM